ncbi:MAG TPA: TonB-dependent receptor, partial [Prevotella sp.]
YDNNAKKTDGNVYGKLTYEFLPGLNAFVDLQYRHISYKMSGSSQEFDDNKKQRPMELDKTYNFFNPKFGLTYDINPNHTVYASYAIAHKEPTRNDFEDMMAEATPVDPKAERLNDLELGYKFQSPIFYAGVNLYYMVYDNQFVLTGAQDANGEMVARNIKDSYRMGAELMAGLRPFKGFSWDINATWSKNRAKNMDITVVDPNTWAESTANVGTTHLAYSPDFILGNLLSYEYKGFKASLQSKFVGEQYMTNSNFRSYLESDGSQTSALIDSYFVNNLDLSYTFKWRGIKSTTLGLTVYNLFGEEYESNGSCSMNFKREGQNIVAYNAGWAWATYSAQAPTHFMAHLSINF